MSQNHSQQVLNYLIKQFTSLGYQTDYPYSLDQYIQMFQKLSATNKQSPGTEMDIGIIEQVFEKSDQNKEQKVRLEQLCSTVLEAELVLKEKIEGTVQHISLFEDQKQQIVQDILITQEEYNREGICLDSQLFLEIKQIEFSAQLQPLQNERFKLVVQCVCQEDQNQYYSKTFGFHELMVEEQFRFKVETKQQVLQIILQSQYSDNLCDIELGVMLLEDQQIREEWVDMKDNDLRQQYEGEVGNVKLFMNLQWIHNKIKLLNQQQNEISERIEELYNDKDDFIYSIQNIHQVFPVFVNLQSVQDSSYSLKAADNHQLSDKKIFENKVVQQQQASKSQLNINNGIYNEHSKRDHENQEDTFNQILQRNTNFFENDQVLKTKYVSLGILVFLMFLSFKKNVFLDILLVVSFLVICYERRIYRGLVVVIGGILGSMVIDCVWLYLKSENWWIEKGVDQFEKRVTVVLTYLMVIVKVYLSWLYVQAYQYYKEQNEELIRIS